MPESTSRPLLPEGVLIAIASAFVYLTSFLYEYGYCSHFDIPAYLIAPSLSTVLVAAAGMGVVVLSSTIYLGFSGPFLRAARNPELAPYRQLFAFAGFALIGGILLTAIYGLHKTGALIYIAFVLINALLFFGPVFIGRKRPIAERLAEHAAIQERDPNTFHRLLEIWFKPQWISWGVNAVLFFGFAFLVGNGEASTQKRFLVFADEPNLVLLRTYGNLLVAGRMDPSSKSVADVTLLWLQEVKRINFRNELVGPLVSARSAAAAGSASQLAPAVAPIDDRSSAPR